MKAVNAGIKYCLLLLILLVTAATSTGCINKPTDSKVNQEKAKPILVEPPAPAFLIPDKDIYPGDYLVFSLKDTLDEDVITFQSDLLNYNPELHDIKGTRITLIGINYRTKAGEYPVRVKIQRSEEKFWEWEETVVIHPKSFTTQYLKVSAQTAAIRDPKLAEQDKADVDKAKSISASYPIWEGKFIQPVEGRVSTEFGLIRYINGIESGRHAGVDIAAPKGTPLQAANSGTVTLAKGLNVSGNTIIIDHGLKAFSAYSHLDEILVKEGQSVKKGDIIGKVGSTGFSTGPHVHWTITINGVFVSPWLMTEKDPLQSLTQ